MFCADCERIENYLFPETTFWLFLPTFESVNKAILFCGNGNYPAAQTDSHSIRVEVKKEQVNRFLLGLFGEFEPNELNASKITTTDGGEPTFSDIGRIVPASVLINRLNSEWIIQAIESHSYETHFQPIFSLDEQGNPSPFAFEGLFRIKDEFNNIVPPSHAFKLAEGSDLLFSLDLIARRSAVGHFRKSGLNGKLFINFNPSSIYDPSYCLRATASAINALGIRPEDVVFEITETTTATDESVMRGILNFYRNAGFGVALDDIGSGWSGLNMLHKYRPDYVKIDMDLVRNLHNDPYKQTIVKHLIQLAHDNGTKVIAEGIESEDELAILQSYRADYYQGFLLAKPQFYGSTLSQEEQTQIDNTLTGIN
ncbi:EAL domain-containing protein [Pseudoalteromonas sp. G4]|uniref:EAL domain-containing protein n=1 Tax=Pseudoalteromonas sp. G4 TaxID=2992761 RepID=UPI00237E4EA5|nr:EAL domain-containing protein [Pseudoalteromonas sp. G4]MDE3270852.1 EAL domain-containing protein [Pseudoalteromonas sp. G4]